MATISIFGEFTYVRHDQSLQIGAWINENFISYHTPPTGSRSYSVQSTQIYVNTPFKDNIIYHETPERIPYATCSPSVQASIQKIASYKKHFDRIVGVNFGILTFLGCHGYMIPFLIDTIPLMIARSTLIHFSQLPVTLAVLGICAGIITISAIAIGILKYAAHQEVKKIKQDPQIQEKISELNHIYERRALDAITSTF